jgi:hypothetical protein
MVSLRDVGAWCQRGGNWDVGKRAESQAARSTIDDYVGSDIYWLP